jgi:hypothetical protein
MAVTRQARQLTELAQLAALASDRALAPVASARARIDVARAAERAMAAHRAALGAEAGADPALAAMLARQAERLRRRQAAALSGLAALEAELEQAKAVARPAYGRRLVLERLAREAAAKR